MIGHRDPETMARVLVGYINCDRRVRSLVREEFDTSQMELRHVARIRKNREREIEFIRRGPQCKDLGRPWVEWAGDEYRADMEIASSVFVKAIERERAA